MTLKMHFTLLAANKVKLEKMNKSTESDFLEFLQKFQISYLPENGILVKSNIFLLHSLCYSQIPKERFPILKSEGLEKKNLWFRAGILRDQSKVLC